MRDVEANGTALTPSVEAIERCEAPGDKGSRARRFRIDQEVPSLLRDVRLPFPPMRLWKYSNLGYTVLGRVVEQVAACPFDRFVRERVIEPLGMTETTYDPATVP